MFFFSMVEKYFLIDAFQMEVRDVQTFVFVCLFVSVRGSTRKTYF